MSWFRRKHEEEIEETRRMVQHAAQLHGVPAQEVVHAILDEDDEDLDDEPRGGMHAGVWITLVVVGAAFGLGIVFLYRLANGAAEAGPTADAGIQAIQKSIQPTPPGLPTLAGQYVAFSYPGVFDSVKTLPNLPTTAERYGIGSSGNYRRSIIVTVENNTATFDDDSGYKYRSISPDLYHPEAVKVAGESGVVMVKNDKTERTLYWAHGGKMVIVSVTSTDVTDALESYMAVITSTIRWVP